MFQDNYLQRQKSQQKDCLSITIREQATLGLVVWLICFWHFLIRKIKTKLNQNMKIIVLITHNKRRKMNLCFKLLTVFTYFAAAQFNTNCQIHQCISEMYLLGKRLTLK